MARDFIGRGFDPRLFARALGLQFDVIALFLGPTHIHAGKNAGPVTALGATRARVDLKKGVVAVGLTVQQRLKLFLGGNLFQCLQRGLGIGDDLLVIFHFAQFDQFDIVVQVAFDPIIGLD